MLLDFSWESEADCIRSSMIEFSQKSCLTHQVVGLEWAIQLPEYLPG